MKCFRRVSRRIGSYVVLVLLYSLFILFLENIVVGHYETSLKVSSNVSNIPKFSSSRRVATISTSSSIDIDENVRNKSNQTRNQIPSLTVIPSNFTNLLKTNLSKPQNPNKKKLQTSLVSLKMRQHRISNVSNLEKDFDAYFKKRPEKVNVFKYDFIIERSDKCDPDTFLIILVHSFHPYRDRRRAIRNTWGSIITTKTWPTGDKITDNIKLLFVLGKHPDNQLNEAVLTESNTFLDIIQGDFIDAYKNMTLKSLLGLKWIAKNCNQATYLLKSDDDMIINMPYLLSILKEKPFKRGILGPYNPGSKVYRKGKWGLTKDVYPFRVFPPYESGSAYIISTDIVGELYETAAYVPWIHIDDVYVTGFLAKVINAEHVTRAGFAYWTTKPPKPCDIIQNRTLTGTRMKPEVLVKLWTSLGEVQCGVGAGHNVTQLT